MSISEMLIMELTSRRMQGDDVVKIHLEPIWFERLVNENENIIGVRPEGETLKFAGIELVKNESIMYVMFETKQMTNDYTSK